MRLRVMALLVSLLVNAFAAEAQNQNLVITETVSATLVEYTVENTGATSVAFSFIIIQDDVLTLSEGDETIPPGDKIIISVACDGVNHSYRLELDSD